MLAENAPVQTTEAPRAAKKYFTVAEANAALPYVSRVIEDVIVVYRQIVRLRRRLEQVGVSPESERLEAQYDTTMDRLSVLIDELHEVGVELKDFEKGLIDFPALHEDREILLCWRKGESRVAHWHEVDAGFASRRPVDQLAA